MGIILRHGTVTAWHPGELNDAEKEEILLKVKEQLS